jgi:hypothetical protein
MRVFADHATVEAYFIHQFVDRLQHLTFFHQLMHPQWLRQTIEYG